LIYIIHSVYYEKCANEFLLTACSLSKRLVVSINNTESSGDTVKETRFSGNQSYLKQLNLMSSLRIIRSKGLISRAELADTLGLNRSTITAVVHQLMEQNFVLEVGIGSSKGGRPPLLLQFNADYAYAACLEWTSEHIRLCVTDLKGQIHWTRTLPYFPNRPPRPQVEQAVEALKTAHAELPPKPQPLLGIVIGVPGIVDRRHVISYDLGWDEMPLADEFASAFDCPVIVENSAHIGLTAERYFGNGLGEANLCYIRINRGVQAGVLYEDRIYRGSEGFVGNFGHLVVDQKGRKCICGNRGCLQAYISEQALLESYGNHTTDQDGVDLPKLIRNAKEKEPGAIRAVHEFAEYLGTGVGNLINLMNPGAVVVDTALAEIGDTIGSALFNRIHKTALPYPRRNVRILFSNLGEQAIPLGAAAILLDHVFAPPQVAAMQ